MLLKLINYLRGTIDVCVTGIYPERFLNLCMQNDIPIWNMKHKNSNELTATIHKKNLRAMYDIMKKCQCHIQVNKKRGIPFILQILRKRPMLWVGLFIFVAAIYITGTRIWSIEMEPLENISEYEIMHQLNKLGVSIGAKASSIEPREIKNQLLSAIDGLSFVAVNVRGNCVVVELEESIAKPEIIDEDQPVQIVSDKTGIIFSMDVKEGRSIKKVGQTALKGDILVDSLMVTEREGIDIPPRLVHSSADIKMRTWYSLERVMPKNINKKEYTGKSCVRYTLVFGEKRVKLFGNGSNPYVYCDKITTETNLHVSESLVVPVRLIKEEMREYELVSCELPQEKQENILVNHGRDELQYNIGDGEIISYETELIEETNRLVLQIEAECLEEVGVSQKDERTLADVLPKEVEEGSLN